MHRFKKGDLLQLRDNFNSPNLYTPANDYVASILGPPPYECIEVVDWEGDKFVVLDKKKGPEWLAERFELFAKTNIDTNSLNKRLKKRNVNQ